MADSLHQITIHCSANTLYQALTQDKGIQAWWTDTTHMAKQEDQHCHLWFDNHQSHFTFRATKMLPAKRVFWLCSAGPDEWIDTQLWWEIKAIDSETCRLDFKHMNWKKDDGLFPLCNSTWGSLLQHLKEYCEAGKVNPWFLNLKATA